MSQNKKISNETKVSKAKREMFSFPLAMCSFHTLGSISFVSVTKSYREWETARQRGCSVKLVACPPFGVMRIVSSPRIKWQ